MTGRYLPNEVKRATIELEDETGHVWTVSLPKSILRTSFEYGPKLYPTVGFSFEVKVREDIVLVYKCPDGGGVV